MIRRNQNSKITMFAKLINVVLSNVEMKLLF
nr:hypothetical protein CJLB15_00025 [Campylobacter phage CJLB-15]